MKVVKIIAESIKKKKNLLTLLFFLGGWGLIDQVFFLLEESFSDEDLTFWFVCFGFYTPNILTLVPFSFLQVFLFVLINLLGTDRLFHQTEYQTFSWLFLGVEKVTLEKPLIKEVARIKRPVLSPTIVVHFPWKKIENSPPSNNQSL